MKVGVPKDSPMRLQEALLYSLQEASLSDGHCYLPSNDLIGRTLKNLRIDVTDDDAIQNLLEQFKRICEAGRIKRHGEDCFYPPLDNAEQKIAEIIKRRLNENGHFFQYMLPKAAQPFDVSIVYGYNSSTIGYRPDAFEGKLGLDISTHNFSFVFGYKPVNFFEVMMSLGYQSAKMLSYGELYQQDPYDIFRKNEIYPDITVKGNNGFRFGIAIALQISSLHPVIGYDYAGKSSFTTNVLYFKSQFGKDKTPDEIAKDKGYVRGGNVKTQSDETEAPAEEPVETPEVPAVEESEAPAAEEDF